MTPTQIERAQRRARRRAKTAESNARKEEFLRVKKALHTGSVHGKMGALHYLRSGQWHRQEALEEPDREKELDPKDWEAADRAAEEGIAKWIAPADDDGELDYTDWRVAQYMEMMEETKKSLSILRHGFPPIK